MKVGFAVILAALQSTPASPPPSQKAPDSSTVVSEVTVTAPTVTTLEGLDVIARCTPPKSDGPRKDAKVVSTYPKYGDIVPAGPILLRVTYDQPMSPCGFLFVLYGLDQPAVIQTPAMLSPDRRSFLFALSLSIGGDFRLSFNPEEKELPKRFRSTSGGYGLPYTLIFRTHLAKPSKTLPEAARLDPEFDALNHQPGRIAILGIPHPGVPLGSGKH